MRRRTHAARPLGAPPPPPQECEALVAKAVRLMLFRQHEKPGVPVKRQDLSDALTVRGRGESEHAHCARAQGSTRRIDELASAEAARGCAGVRLPSPSRLHAAKCQPLPFVPPPTHTHQADYKKHKAVRLFPALVLKAAQARIIATFGIEMAEVTRAAALGKRKALSAAGARARARARARGMGLRRGARPLRGATPAEAHARNKLPSSRSAQTPRPT